MAESDILRIPRAQFETLVRRADTVRNDTDYVHVLRTEHEELLRISYEYKALRSALIAAGIAEDNLDLLINTPASPASKQTEIRPSRESRQWSAEASTFVPAAGRRKARNTFYEASIGHSVPPTPPSLSNEVVDEEPEVEQWHEEKEELHEDNHVDRSIILRGLPPSTTMADVARVVRGGLVLNMFMRPRGRTAHVAFVDPSAAERCIIHSKRSDIHIKGKRIEVYWDERQHWMPGHIARRIQNGATRNLVVRFANPNMTSESIREDLEHIHNLHVVDVDIKDGHAYISTNGIRWAVTARTCMTSRLKYKGTKIEFFGDECDQPLPPVVKRPPKPSPTAAKKAATISHMNRFAILVEEGEEQFEEAHTADVALDRTVPAGL